VNNRYYLKLGDLFSGSLNDVVKKLNSRPRKTPDFRTPAQVLDEALH
jgi:IS30 family transposase